MPATILSFLPEINRRRRIHSMSFLRRSLPTLVFLAKPSRLPVGLHDGITGAVYVFDAYKNLIVTPLAGLL